MKTTNFDTSALKARILGQGTITEFAAGIGMSPRALGRRLAGKTEFNMGEVRKITIALNLNEDEMERLFFTPVEMVEIADMFLEMSNKQKTLLLRIISMMDTPARQEFAASWKGKMSDLPAALAQI